MVREKRNMQRNGVDLDLLQGPGETMSDQPEAGTVIIRARHRWHNEG
jgi:hypothetical protein